MVSKGSPRLHQLSGGIPSEPCQVQAHLAAHQSSPLRRLPRQGTEKQIEREKSGLGVPWQNGGGNYKFLHLVKGNQAKVV